MKKKRREGKESRWREREKGRKGKEGEGDRKEREDQRAKNEKEKLEKQSRGVIEENPKRKIPFKEHNNQRPRRNKII